MGILQAIALQDQSITTSLGGGLEMTIKKTEASCFRFLNFPCVLKSLALNPTEMITEVF